MWPYWTTCSCSSFSRSSHGIWLGSKTELWTRPFQTLILLFFNHSLAGHCPVASSRFNQMALEFIFPSGVLQKSVQLQFCEPQLCFFVLSKQISGIRFNMLSKVYLRCQMFIWELLNLTLGLIAWIVHSWVNFPLVNNLSHSTIVSWSFPDKCGPGIIFIKTVLISSLLGIGLTHA